MSTAAVAIGVLTRPRQLIAGCLLNQPPSQPIPGEAKKTIFPSYLPPGYRYLTTYVGRGDGFGGGNKEIALWFKNPWLVNGYNNPLTIFVTTEVKHEFYLTEQRVPEPLRVSINGQAIDAAYHDGMWVAADDGERIHPTGRRQHWETQNAHSLVFSLNNFVIGIRGARRAGVTRDELVRVASSLQ